MTLRRRIAGALLAICPLACAGDAPRPPDRSGTYSGTSDASAASAAGGGMFLVADDENNALRLYRVDRPGPPVRTVRWDAHLGLDASDSDSAEADIEGAAALGERVYWVSSHGRNSDGEWRASRHQFFATTIRATGREVSIKPFGRAYHDLARDLARSPKLRGLGLAKALQPDDRKDGDLAPKKRGLNIEALAAGADGRSLLIGFRNPRPGGRALLVPLRNPAAVVGEGAKPAFGEAILLDLGRGSEGRHALGIRGMVYSPRHRAYLVLAGPHDGGGPFALYTWSGGKADRPRRLERATAALGQVPKLTPETLLVHPHAPRVQVLSDDGTLKVKVRSPAECLPGTYKDGRCSAKHLLDPARKTFRSLWVDTPSSPKG